VQQNVFFRKPFQGRSYLSGSRRAGLGCPCKLPFAGQRWPPSGPPPIAGTPPAAWRRPSPLCYQRAEEADPHMSQEEITRGFILVWRRWLLAHMYTIMCICAVAFVCVPLPLSTKL